MTAHITAIICTHNRASYLQTALDSLFAQTLPERDYDVMLIDNGSSDHTRQVAAAYGRRPNFRYVYEGRLGLSWARNTGWQRASTPLIAYLDDDAIACSDWLERIVSTFERLRPVPGCVGGRVEPLWEAPPPEWLDQSLVPLLSVIDWSDTPTYLSELQWLVGANIAFPRPLLAALGGFRTNLGRQGQKLLSEEETLLRRQMQQRGFGSFYDPAIAVQHIMKASLLTKQAFTQRSYWQGVSHAIAEADLRGLGASARLVRGGGRCLQALLPHNLLGVLQTTSDPRRFAATCQAWRRLGYAVGMLGIAN